MTVKKYVMSMVENSAKYRKINVGEEVWNILYILLHDYGIKASDKVEDCSEDLKGFVDSRESDFIHFYESLDGKKYAIEALEKIESDIRFALKHYEPEDLPHRPIRMTVTEEDVYTLKNALHWLKEESN